MRVCVFAIRNLGDSVMCIDLIAKLQSYNREIDIDVVCKPGHELIFESAVPFVNKIYKFKFPLGKDKKIYPIDLIKFFIFTTKKLFNRYDITFNIFGHCADNFVQTLTPTKSAIMPDWPYDHKFRGIIGNKRWFVSKQAVTVPNTCNNIYETINLLLERSGFSTSSLILSKRVLKTKNFTSVGFHPFASDRNKELSIEKWLPIVTKLASHGFAVYCFGTPSDFDRINKNVLQYIASHSTISAGPIDSFFHILKSLDVFIGLDSFSVHAASMYCSKVVTITSSPYWEFYLPPNATVLKPQLELKKINKQGKYDPNNYNFLDEIGLEQINELIDSILNCNV